MYGIGDNMSKIDKFFESKTFKQIVQITMLILWAICGVAGFYIIPGTDLKSQWAYGFLFGVGFLVGSKLIATKLFWLLYNNIHSFRKHVQTHWGNTE